MVRKIIDVGVKLGNAAKDIRGNGRLTLSVLAELSDIDKLDMVTKDRIWPKPDFEGLVKNGMHPYVVAYIKLIRERIGNKPRANIRGADINNVYEGYVKILSMIENNYRSLKNPEDIHLFYQKIRMSVTGDMEKEISTNIEKHQMWSVYKNKNSPFKMDRSDHIRLTQIATDMSLDSDEKLLKEFRVMEYKKNNVVTGYAGIYKNSQWLTRSGLVSQSMVNPGDCFESRTEMIDYIKDNQELFGRKKSADREVRIGRAHLAKLVRTGPDFRSQPVSPMDLKETFGFNAVEFGEWLSDSERQDVLNKAYDAFSDLANVLNILPRDIGLDNTLSIAFGSRGKASAMAHYEPGLVVINLTRIRGAGSLAHEYAHALDHYIIKQRAGTIIENGHVSFASKAYNRLSDAEYSVWHDMMSSFFTKPWPIRLQNESILHQNPALRLDKALMSQMELDSSFLLPCDEKTRKKMVYRTEFLKHAMRSKKHAYYASSHEMFARAFESFVYDRLTSMRYQSDYLVNSVQEDYWQTAGYDFNPYPAGSERALFNEKIEYVIDASLKNARERFMESQDHSLDIKTKIHDKNQIEMTF